MIKILLLLMYFNVSYSQDIDNSLHFYEFEYGFIFDESNTFTNLNQHIINAKENIEIEDNPNIYEDLKIIPNPSSGIANIQFKSESNGNVEMQIITLDGQTIAVRNFAKQSNIVNYEFNTKTFSNGTYFVKIILDGKQRITKKIIIQN